MHFNGLAIQNRGGQPIMIKHDPETFFIRLDESMTACNLAKKSFTFDEGRTIIRTLYSNDRYDVAFCIDTEETRVTIWDRRIMDKKGQLTVKSTHLEDARKWVVRQMLDL